MTQSAAAPKKSGGFQDYVTVAERIEKFYERFSEGRIITNIVEHDPERGFILMRAEVYRNADDALPMASGHAYELKTEGYVQRTSYIEVCETSSVGRALAMAGFEVKRGIASREEMEKIEGHPAGSQNAGPLPATEDQKNSILSLLESRHPGNKGAQRKLLIDLSGKQSRDDLTNKEAAELIKKLQAQN